MAIARINKEVLNTVIKEYELSITELEKKTNTSQEKIKEWLDVNSNKYPTWNFMEKISNITLYPLPYFFFPFVVEEYINPESITKDFRKNEKITPELRAILVEAKNIIEDYKELTELEDKPFVGDFTTEQKEEIITHIKNNFFVSKTKRIKKSESYLAKQVERLEEKGFLIIQKGFVGNSPKRRLPPDVIAGFSISDKKAPLIFINTNLPYEAQIFTLFHEVTHILLGESASDTHFHNKDIDTEKLCDEVAATILIPSNELIQLWKKLEGKEIEEKIKIASGYFLVSKSAIVYNARRLKLISEDFYKKFFNTNREAKKKQKKRRFAIGSSGSSRKTYYRRFGKNYVEAIINSLYDGKISYTEAAKMLQLRYDKLQTIL